MMRVLRCFPAVAVVWAAAAAGAESLEEAWSLALAADHRLHAKQEQVEAARWGVAEARSAYRPSVTNYTGYTFLSDTPTATFAVPGIAGLPALSLPLAESQFAASATLATMPLYAGGRIRSAVHAAGCQVESARMDHATTVMDVKLEVATYYTMVLRAERGVEVAEGNVASLAAHTRDVENLLAQGLVARNALLAAEVAHADARQRAIQAHHGLDSARAAYNRLLGRPLGAPVTLADVAASPPEGELTTWTETAIGNRPELAALASEANVLRHQAASQRGARLPQVGLVGGFGYLENQHLDPNGLWSLTVGMEWTPFDGGTSAAQRSALEHNARALDRLRADARSAITLEVRRAWHDAWETHQRIEVNRRAIAQAEENLRVARDRFNQGVGTNTEVLDAETLRTLTFSNFYGAVYDAVLAGYRLRRAAGTL